MGAAKGNKNALGNKGGGRPSTYKPEYAEWAEKLAKLGATDAQLANSFEVCETTIAQWKRKYVEFSAALKNGKEFADAAVASSLFHRAIGYHHQDVDIKVIDKEIIQTPIIKRYPPDTTAAIFWLKNRRPAEWRDKVQQEHTGENGGPVQMVFTNKDADL